MDEKLQLATGSSQVFWNNDTFHATGLGLYRQPYTYNSSFIIHYHTPGKNYLRTIYFLFALLNQTCHVGQSIDSIRPQSFGQKPRSFTSSFWTSSTSSNAAS